MHFSEIIRFMPRRTIGIFVYKNKKKKTYTIIVIFLPDLQFHFGDSIASLSVLTFATVLPILLFFFTIHMIFALNFPRNSTICEI